MTEDDLEDIRRKRVQEMKLRQQKMQQWKINVFYEFVFLSLIFSCLYSVHDDKEDPTSRNTDKINWVF